MPKIHDNLMKKGLSKVEDIKDDSLRAEVQALLDSEE